MQNRTAVVLVVLACLFLLLVRAPVFIGADAFSDDSSYLLARQAQNLADGQDITFDKLSGTGQPVIVSNIVYFTYPFVKLFPAKFVLLALINMAAVLLGIVTYYLAYTITKDKQMSLIGVALVLLAPALTRYGLLSINVTILSSLLVLFSCITFSKTTKRLPVEQKNGLIITTILLYVLALLIDPVAIIFPLSILLYFMFNKSEKKHIPKIHLQLWLTSFAISVWFLLLSYKDALVLNGFSTVHANIPFALRASSFVDVKLFLLLSDIGIFPLLLASLAIYESFNHKYDRTIVLLGCMLLTTVVLFLLTVIPLEKAAIVTSVLVAIISVKGLLFIKQFLAKLKHKSLSSTILYGIIALALLAQVLSFSNTFSFVSSTVPYFEQETIDVISSQPVKSIVFVPITHAHEMQYRSGFPVALDSNFLLVDNVQLKLNALDDVFTSLFATDAIAGINALGSGANRPAIIVSDALLPSRSANCWELVYAKKHFIYRTTCDVIERG